jgi:hypothetical protein
MTSALAPDAALPAPPGSAGTESAPQPPAFRRRRPVRTLLRDRTTEAMTSALAPDAALPAPPAPPAPSPRRSRRHFDDADLLARYFVIEPQKP